MQRLFRRHLGTSLIQYLIRLRMEAAGNMLGFTDQSVKSVALSVGYANPLYFSLEFRKHAGVPPTVFRERKKREYSEPRSYPLLTLVPPENDPAQSSPPHA